MSTLLGNVCKTRLWPLVLPKHVAADIVHNICGADFFILGGGLLNSVKVGITRNATILHQMRIYT